jgi:hypothetical protein
MKREITVAVTNRNVEISLYTSGSRAECLFKKREITVAVTNRNVEISVILPVQE